MALPSRLKFGIFMGPFHPLGENPTLALERDLELIQWLDYLGYDEAWVGEHHSAGWETIGSPEVFLAVASERTKHIKLGSGVVSLPYHNPYMIAERAVLLDHLTRGRFMLGLGPGALPSDAKQLGIPMDRIRPRLEEGIGIIKRLMTDVEPLTYESDWFTLHEARLQLRPFTQPHMPMAVTAVNSPSGMIAAGRHGAGVLSFINPRPQGEADDALRDFWTIGEKEAEKHGQTLDRANWRLVVNCYLSETREQAWEECHVTAGRHVVEYGLGTLGFARDHSKPLPHHDDALREAMDRGLYCIGTPEDLCALIDRLMEKSGGFGGLMLLANEWATREQIRRHFELLARYVMPRYQGSLAGLAASQATVSRESADNAAVGNAASLARQQQYAETRAQV
jgi:limonene 1,2-monooxygenase